MDQPTAKPGTKPVTPPTPPPTKPNNPAPAIPHVDPQAALKIETAIPSPEEQKISYGEKTFFAGILFTIIIIVSVAGVVFLWIQNTTQIQKPVTIEKTK